MCRHLTTLDDQSIEYRRQREVIIERCLPLADNIARRFSNRGEPLEDLVQVARMGLVQAVDRFDAENGADFLAFAVPTVMGEVRRYFRDHGWSVKVPRRMKELGPQLNRAREELSQRFERAPTASEVASHLGIELDEVVQAQIAASAYSTLSSDAPSPSTAGDDDGRSVRDSFGDLDANLDRVLDVETVRPLVAALPERQQAVLMLRFFGNMTQTQIAERLGIAQMHVSRLLARSLATLRKEVQTPLPVLVDGFSSMASNPEASGVRRRLSRWRRRVSPSADETATCRRRWGDSSARSIRQAVSTAKAQFGGGSTFGG